MVRAGDGDYMSDYIPTELYTYPASDDAGWEDDPTMESANMIDAAEIARQLWNRDPANQHHHNWTVVDEYAHYDKPEIREAMAAVYERYGYATLARNLRNFHLQRPRQAAAPNWDWCTPAERKIIFPWSACLVYKVDYNICRFQPVDLRNPRLLRLMRWVAILSTGEAIAALLDYRLGRKYSGEAVNHYGPEAEGWPTRYLIRKAIENRHIIRDHDITYLQTSRTDDATH